MELKTDLPPWKKPAQAVAYLIIILHKDQPVHGSAPSRQAFMLLFKHKNQGMKRNDSSKGKKMIHKSNNETHVFFLTPAG
jgi:hypothetical protein